ncbi:MAG: FadR family transcriptional regulator [Lentisphaeria bacterium]|nr:FadR family transcriptional regulator [Lentisphaeria bacterium]
MKKDLNKVSTFEAAVKAICDYLIENKLQPGDALPPEPALASTLGISRNILREALRHYRTLGLIVSKPKVGTVLKTLVPENPYAGYFPILAAQTDLRPKLAEMRYSLEAGFSPYIIQRATGEGIAHLRKICERFRQSYSQEQICFADMEFHITLLEMAENPLLSGLIPLVIHFFATGNEENAVNTNPVKADEEYLRHTAIVNAIAAGDAELLTQLLRKHYAGYEVK